MDKFTNILAHAHSGLRWVVLIVLIAAIINASKKKGSGIYTLKDKKLNLYAMLFLHIQLVIGLVLYFLSPKVNFEHLFASPMNRFYGLEHVFGMILAILLTTIGHSKAKRADNNNKKHSTIFLAYFFALILIIASIPWPFRELGGKWF